MQIIIDSELNFGSKARERYDSLIRAALNTIIQNPETLGSHPRDDLGLGTRTYHLALSRNHCQRADRVKNPRHVLVYRTENEGTAVAIGRVLHDAMNPSLHLGAETWVPKPSK